METLPHTCEPFKLNLHRRSEQDDERMEPERQEWKGCGRRRDRIQWEGCGIILSGVVHSLMSYKANVQKKFFLPQFWVNQSKSCYVPTERSDYVL